MRAQRLQASFSKQIALRVFPMEKCRHAKKEQVLESCFAIETADAYGNPIMEPIGFPNFTAAAADSLEISFLQKQGQNGALRVSMTSRNG